MKDDSKQDLLLGNYNLKPLCKTCRSEAKWLYFIGTFRTGPCAMSNYHASLV